MYFLMETVFLFIKSLLSHWSNLIVGKCSWRQVVVAVVEVYGSVGDMGGWLLFVHYLFDKHSSPVVQNLALFDMLIRESNQ